MSWARPKLRKIRGLGDAVAIVVQPAAIAIDAVLGTSLANCGGCVGRREALNRNVPFGKQVDRPH